jgi:predicted DNA-binding transcriptional regulator YafY
MNRIDRLTAILIQLQTKRWITASEIACRFEISMRTVYRDIRALEEAGVPIGAETGKGYFIVEGFHLPPVMFTKEEAGALLIAGKLIDKFTDSSMRMYYSAVTDKIKSILPEESKDTLEEMNSQVEVFYGAQNPSAEFPNNFLSSIQKAFAIGKCIEIDYHAGYSQKRSAGRIVDPIGLVFYVNAWHLIGHCKLRNEMRDFRLDRILQLKLTEQAARKKDKHELKKYFKEFWTISDLYEIKVWFHNSILSAISTSRYYFGYLDEYPEGDGSVITFAVNDYAYILYWLLSFDDKIKIISPLSLKEKMTLIVRRLSDIYLP